MFEILFMSGLFLVLLVAGYVAALLMRQRFRGDDGAATGPAFNLDQLRSMHAQGKLSDAEFEKARHAIVQAAKAQMLDPKSKRKPSPTDPKL